MRYMVQCLSELLNCRYELALLALRMSDYERFEDDLFQADMVDLEQRYAIIEERKAVFGEGHRIVGNVPDGGSSSGGNPPKESSKEKKNIEDAFRKGLKNKDSKETVNAIIDNHEALAEFTPDSMKSFLEECGYEVRPLGKSSSLKGTTFEQGGGYRVSFGGDGYFQYHPKTGSHHGKVPYWRVSNGERGDNRYGMDGKEFQE